MCEEITIHGQLFLLCAQNIHFIRFGMTLTSHQQRRYSSKMLTQGRIQNSP